VKRLFTLALAIATTACATTPAYNRGWSTFERNADGENAAMLVYGAPASDDVDLFAVCDRDAKVFEMAVFTGDTSRPVAERARTEVIIGPAAVLRRFDATVQYVEMSGEMMLVARTGLPPEFVRSWAGERITLAGQGTAMTLLARPDKAMIEDFLKHCAR
jgi:hypothetical protein